MITSKWGWLEAACKEQGLRRSAKLAGEMQEELCALYVDDGLFEGDDAQIILGRSMDDAQDFFMVLNSPRTCPACVLHWQCCKSECRFGQNESVCLGNSILFDKFQKMVCKEWRK
jgi:hypothetical protein